MAKEEIPKKKWYTCWWAIVLYVFVGLAIIGAILPNQDKTPSQSNVPTNSQAQTSSPVNSQPPVSDHSAQAQTQPTVPKTQTQTQSPIPHPSASIPHTQDFSSKQFNITRVVLLHTLPYVYDPSDVESFNTTNLSSDSIAELQSLYRRLQSMNWDEDPKPLLAELDTKYGTRLKSELRVIVNLITKEPTASVLIYVVLYDDKNELIAKQDFRPYEIDTDYQTTINRNFVAANDLSANTDELFIIVSETPDILDYCTEQKEKADGINANTHYSCDLEKMNELPSIVVLRQPASEIQDARRTYTPYKLTN